MTTDVLHIVQWWSILLLLGGLTFPLTFSLFPTFTDRGYGLTKILGIIILSYAVFLLGSLHLIPFTTLGLFLVLILTFGGIGGILFKKDLIPLRKSFLPFLRTHWHLLVLEELLFLTIFILWSIIRSYEPTINGLEKFMDYGFINSILRSDYFPAQDMWLSPHSINYYYFGHLATAVLTKLTFLPSSVTYNLMLATLAGLCFNASFSLGATLISLVDTARKKVGRFIVPGLLSALLVTFSGNLHPLYTLFKPYPNESPVPLWELAFSPLTFPNSYWYPNATRFIYNTIHEFPIYSWVVSDLHGHVLDIPFVLLTIAVLLSFFLHFQQLPTSKKASLPSTFSLTTLKAWLDYLITPFTLSSLLFISFLLAILYMTNAWDGIIYLLLTGLILLYLLWQDVFTLKTSLTAKLVTLGGRLVVPVVVLGVGFFIFSLPFSLSFKPFVSGIGILCAPQFLTNLGAIGPFLFEPDHCQRSPLWQLFILHGFFYLFVTLFFIFLTRTKKIFTSDIFVLFLILLSTMLIAIPEFAYMKDIYPAHYRANTMFKLVFQSFIMLSLSTGYIIARIGSVLKRLPGTKGKIFILVFFTGTFMLLLIIFSYPYYAVMSYYGELKTHHGLNGISYLKDRYPTDYEAIVWLNKNIEGQPVILEAQGDSYTDYARVSSNTGLPTVLGWTVHEWLWRGSYDIPAPRIEEIKTIYESDDLKQTKDLLEKYEVQYVFLGDLEREKYLEINEEKFEELGEVIFQKGQTKIIQVSNQ